MKHTQGEWIYEDGIIKTKDKLPLFHFARTAEEVEANAKLIAAAPDLLEALIELKKWVGKLDDWKGIDPPTDIVDAAIKKAME